eukprot:1195982-Prorocentrum_minimum.AAC.1
MLAETSASSAKMRDEESRRHTEETEHLRRHLWKYPDDTYERTQHVRDLRGGSFHPLSGSFRLLSGSFRPLSGSFRPLSALGLVSPALGLVSPALGLVSPALGSR